MSELSDAFRKIADAIDANEGRPFGGAFVVCAPPRDVDEESEILSGLLLDASQDASQFWGFVKGKVDSKILDMQEEQRRGVVRR